MGSWFATCAAAASSANCFCCIRNIKKAPPPAIAANPRNATCGIPGISPIITISTAATAKALGVPNIWVEICVERF